MPAMNFARMLIAAMDRSCTRNTVSRRFPAVACLNQHVHSTGLQARNSAIFEL